MKTKILSTIAGVTIFFGWLVTLTPEQQNSILAPLIALIPPAWQSWVGLTLKVIGTVSGILVSFRLRNKHPIEEIKP